MKLFTIILLVLITTVTNAAGQSGAIGNKAGQSGAIGNKAGQSGAIGGKVISITPIADGVNLICYETANKTVSCVKVSS